MRDISTLIHRVQVDLPITLEEVEHLSDYAVKEFTRKTDSFEKWLFIFIATILVGTMLFIVLFETAS